VSESAIDAAVAAALESVQSVPEARAILSQLHGHEGCCDV
jgi:hypothetical protein